MYIITLLIAIATLKLIVSQRFSAIAEWIYSERWKSTISEVFFSIFLLPSKQKIFISYTVYLAYIFWQPIWLSCINCEMPHEASTSG